MKREQFGELMVDHRASPGLSPAELAGFGGFKLGQLPLAEGKVFEAKTKSCAHCGSVVVLNLERTRERGHCRKCSKYTCDACTALGDCRPIMALADGLLGTDKPLSALHPLITRRY